MTFSAPDLPPRPYRAHLSGGNGGHVLMRTKISREASDRRNDRLTHVVAAIVVGAFVVSTIPGVRPHPGYNILLDGFLNNLAYAVAPVLCMIRARRSSEFRAS